MSLLSWLLVTLAGLSLATMAVSLIIAARSAREARTTIFPIVREEETVRARRARITVSVSGVIAAIMAVTFFLSGSGQLPSPVIAPAQSPNSTAEVVAAVEPSPTEVSGAGEPLRTPTAEVSDVGKPVLTSEQSPSPTTEPSPTRTPLATESPTPTQPLPTPTSPPTSTPVPPSPTPAGTPVPAPDTAEFGPIVFSSDVTERREAVNPTEVFSDTISRVYGVFPYSGMRNGLEWTQVWYIDGVEFNRGEDVWEWGSTDRSYVFTRLVGAGDYRLELYVNDELLSSGEFTVQGEVAVGGPENPEGQ